jgi:hypothetical protein
MCPSCVSSNQAEFSSEMLIHLSGLTNIDKPALWLFPKLLVCLDCGFFASDCPSSRVDIAGRRYSNEWTISRQGMRLAVTHSLQIDSRRSGRW